MSGFRVFVANHRQLFTAFAPTLSNIYFKLVASYIVFYFTEIPFFTLC